MKNLSPRDRLWGAGIALVAAVAGAAMFFTAPGGDAQATDPSSKAAPATPVSVAIVEPRDATIWDEFSGRLEAVERVEVRPRVAGAVQAVHFREGAMVKQGDLLITIDPAPYVADVQRAEARVVAAQARLSLAKADLDRARRLWESRTNSQRDLDVRLNAHQEAEANLRAAQAELQSARLNLSYTEVRAPVSGRVGKLEITVGNLVAAGPGAPVLTTLVSIDPVYASFNADEQAVMRALKTLSADSNRYTQLERIPVQMETATSEGTPYQGHLQLIDNQVDTRSGTVRARAVFDNADGRLMPGQFVRLRMGRAKAEPLLLVNERAVGTDQDKKFVFVVDAANKAAYREVTLGASVDGLRVVTSGLNPGERIILNGLQRIRPGVQVAPQLVRMDATSMAQAQTSTNAAEILQR